MGAGGRLGRVHRLNQRANAVDGHDTFEFVGQHVQGHIRTNSFQLLHLEVGIAYPIFDGAERVLVEAPLGGLKKVFVFPAGDPA